LAVGGLEQKKLGNFFQRVLKPEYGLVISSRLSGEFRNWFRNIVIFHLAAFVAASVAAYYWPLADNASGFFPRLLVLASLASLIPLFAGLLILWTTLRSEILIRQTYDSSQLLSRATTHAFSDFESHIVWAKTYVSPEHFPSRKISLSMAFSTPVYGLAVKDSGKSALLFMDYLEEWVSHFEKMPLHAAERPTWDICLWGKEPHLKTFAGKAIDPDANADHKKYILRFCDICKRIYRLSVNRQVTCNLYFSDETHTRWFFLKEDDERIVGLLALFSPLSASAIKNGKWGIVGFSFRDREAYEHLAHFYIRLQSQDFEVSAENKIECFKSPEQWLADHYGMKQPLSKTP